MSTSGKVVATLVLVGALAAGYLGGKLAGLRSATQADASAESAERVVIQVAPRGDVETVSEAQSPEVAQLSAQGNAFKNAAARVRDAVVFIQVQVHSRATDDTIVDAFGDRIFRDRMLPRSVGSGVVVSADGYVATNYHVVEGARKISVTLTDKRVFEASLVGTDPSTDLAVLKIEAGNLSSVVLGNSDAVDIGEWVLAIGNPFRLRSTVTAGIVSAIGRDVDIINDGTGIEDFIQTDAAINPGNSGGALVNLRGELIGINTAIATESGSNEGYGFAVPSNLVARVVKDLIEYGEVQRGYLGVTVRPITVDRAEFVGMDRAAGVELQEVAFGLAAHRAGLRAGDVLLAINEQEIDEPNQLQSAVARRTPGDTLRVRYWRDRMATEMNVVILGVGDPATGRWLARQLDQPRNRRADEPGLESPHETVAALGVVAAAAGPAIRNSFSYDGGVYVLSVLGHGPAASVGMHEDVLIVAINGESINSVADLKSASGDAEAGARILVEVVRRDGSHFFYEVPRAKD